MLATKVRPVPCGDVLRRTSGATFYRQYGQQLAGGLESWGQYDVVVPGGVEIMALIATLGFQEPRTLHWLK